MCIGVGRSGTTWIYKLLDSHKDISMALGKETNYFNNFYRTHSIDWYQKQFSTQKNYKIFGEVSNNYYFNDNADFKQKITSSYLNACSRILDKPDKT